MRTLFHWIHQIFFSRDKSKSMRRLRWASQTLIISVSLNIALLVTFIYKSITEPIPHPLAAYYYREEQSSNFEQLKETPRKREVFQNLQKDSLKKLSSLLGKREMIEDGLSLGDLALSVLVKEHHFDIARALGREVSPTIKLLIGDETSGDIDEWFLYQSLTLHEKKEINRFALTEEWPLTSEGLFKEMQRRISSREPIGRGLVRSFLLTKEYLAMELVLRRQKQRVRKKEVLALALSGDFELLSSVYKRQQLAPNFTANARFDLLAQYVSLNSRPAVNLLLRENPRELARWGDHAFVLSVLNVARSNTQGMKAFCMEILTGPRGEEIWKEASRILYKQKGRALPLPFSHVKALRELIPEVFLKEKLEMAFEIKRPSQQSYHQEDIIKTTTTHSEKRTPQIQKYRVVEGDSLWKIARKFNTKIPLLKEYNQLESDELHVGKELIIPK